MLFAGLGGGVPHTIGGTLPKTSVERRVAWNRIRSCKEEDIRKS
jgi:hypothetical protein